MKKYLEIIVRILDWKPDMESILGPLLVAAFGIGLLYIYAWSRV